jgi:hypothetical protein
MVRDLVDLDMHDPVVIRLLFLHEESDHCLHIASNVVDTIADDPLLVVHQV